MDFTQVVFTLRIRILFRVWKIFTGQKKRCFRHSKFVVAQVLLAKLRSIETRWNQAEQVDRQSLSHFCTGWCGEYVWTFPSIFYHIFFHHPDSPAGPILSKDITQRNWKKPRRPLHGVGEGLLHIDTLTVGLVLGRSMGKMVPHGAVNTSTHLKSRWRGWCVTIKRHTWNVGQTDKWHPNYYRGWWQMVTSWLIILEKRIRWPSLRKEIIMNILHQDPQAVESWKMTFMQTGFSVASNKNQVLKSSGYLEVWSSSIIRSIWYGILRMPRTFTNKMKLQRVWSH